MKRRRQKPQGGARSARGERGVIVAHLGVAVEVERITGERRRVRVARRSGHVVGDEVLIEGERLSRLERRNELKRRAPGGGVHVVAANLDVLGIVVAVEPPPRVGLIDRAAVAARAAGIEPFVLGNKVDRPGAAVVVEKVRRTFSPPLEVLAVSAKTGEGLDGLRALLREKGRAALFGHSGVGKTSITNRLLPGLDLEVGALSEATGKGRHTTTVATLHRLPEGGELVDTPGVREYGLADVTPEELARHFVGFHAVADEPCRFRDCLHQSEPGCRVRAAVKEGIVDESRYLAYRELLEEVIAMDEERAPW